MPLCECLYVSPSIDFSLIKDYKKRPKYRKLLVSKGNYDWFIPTLFLHFFLFTICVPRLLCSLLVFLIFSVMCCRPINSFSSILLARWMWLLGIITLCRLLLRMGTFELHKKLMKATYGTETYERYQLSGNLPREPFLMNLI